MRRDDGAPGARHWCPLCGRVDRTDEDGCCLTCGADTGPVPDTLGERLVALAERAACGVVLVTFPDGYGRAHFMQPPRGMALNPDSQEDTSPALAVAALEAAIADGAT